jgi:rod shape-determining protein MreD
MMRICTIAAILLVNAIVQSALLPFLQIVGIQPDTLLILTACFALLGGGNTGMLAGFFGGLLQDVLYGHSIGVNAFQYMVIGYLIGLLYEKVFVDKIFVPMVVVFLGALLRGFMMMLYLYFNRVGMPFYFGFARVIVPEALYTSAFTLLIFRWLSSLYQQRFMSRKWHFRRI